MSSIYDFKETTAALRSFVSEKYRLAPPQQKIIAPRVSIVMPCFNQVRYIERSILSVLHQGYSNLEFIIIDGGSTDGSLNLITKYSDDIAYWHSRPDKGQSDALNQGLSRATGDIIGWLNSDDLYLPGAFEVAAKAFSDNPSSKVVFGDWLEIDEFDNVIDLNFAFDFNLRHFAYEGFHLNSQAMFIRRDALLRFGEFDIGLHRTMDYDLILRLGLNEGQRAFKRIEEPLACFRRHPDQKTLGFDSVVENEHRRIAAKSGFNSKFSTAGKALRAAYRVRRAYWYTLRGGISYTSSKFRGVRTK